MTNIINVFLDGTTFNNGLKNSLKKRKKMISLLFSDLQSITRKEVGLFLFLFLENIFHTKHLKKKKKKKNVLIQNK